MPQLPTGTAEEYGADDETKEYKQEDGDGSENSNVDVVNDIKTDLISKHADEQSFESGKSSLGETTHYTNLQPDRNIKADTSQGVYGRPAPVIVGPHRYYEHASYPPGTSSVSHATPRHPVSNTTGTQIHVPVYGRDQRGYFDHRAWQHPQVPVVGSGAPHPYAAYYPPTTHSGKGPDPTRMMYPDFRHPSHPSMVPPNSAMMPYGSPIGPGMYGSQQPQGKMVLTKEQKKQSHVKKPLNAFMLYMKEMRPKIAAECTLKESAAINQILGKRWHALDRSEQAKYYEMARKERALHLQRYPGWSARDNYAQQGRKKKRRKDKNLELNPKKCRARYGLDRQDQWCKPCRRKKKCVRFVAGLEGNGGDNQEFSKDDSDGGGEDDDDDDEDDADEMHDLPHEEAGHDSEAKENHVVPMTSNVQIKIEAEGTQKPAIVSEPILQTLQPITT